MTELLDNHSYRLRFKRSRIFLWSSMWIFIFLYPAVVFLAGASAENFICSLLVSLAFGLSGSFEANSGMVSEFDQNSAYFEMFGLKQKCQYSDIKAFRKVPLFPVWVIRRKNGGMVLIPNEKLLKNPEAFGLLKDKIFREMSLS